MFKCLARHTAVHQALRGDMQPASRGWLHEHLRLPEYSGRTARACEAFLNRMSFWPRRSHFRKRLFCQTLHTARQDPFAALTTNLRLRRSVSSASERLRLAKMHSFTKTLLKGKVRRASALLPNHESSSVDTDLCGPSSSPSRQQASQQRTASRN